jgi:hypothetical protein
MYTDALSVILDIVENTRRNVEWKDMSWRDPGILLAYQEKQREKNVETICSVVGTFRIQITS